MARGQRDFRALTIKHDGRANRIITDVGLTPPFDPRKLPDQKFPYDIKNTRALWDTGATNSVITSETAARLALVPVGTVDVVHYGGQKQSNTHLVNLFLPNQVMVPGILVTESDEIVNDFGVIIGMDVICSGDFSITNFRGKTWMSFRVPSIKSIDYVVEAKRIRLAKSKRK